MTARNKDDVSMNEEFQKWIEETKSANKDALKHGKKSKTDGKKPKGNCQICGEKTAKFVCLKCGKSVCISCHFKIIGVCKKCIPKDKVEKWEEKHPDWEKELGVDWVD